MRGILDRRESFRERARGTVVDARRRTLPQRFVRTLVVKRGPEAIKRPLLCATIPRGRPLRLRLERPMHSLMPSILLRVPRLDQLGPNAEAEPPNAQRRQ